MEFFEKLGKKASETYKTAAEKTNKIAGDTKLKVKISDNKSKINDLYMEIGKKVYQKYKQDGNIDIKDDIKAELENIDKLAEEIEKYETERLELSDMIQCPNCKNKVEKNAKYCPVCGAELTNNDSTVEIIESDDKEEGLKENGTTGSNEETPE